ncbi:filamentous hemagglutinin N-terminal domain-containing protein [Atlantibacter sp.]|uniref:two-partner secretion domain-containing protein n=1 Tax=Atlantibacter sp. TaxID=1903473 RepID=UPI0028ABE540|nr:filamentous hemagglutinin N-terminal domain-containing protein [Atlantibacter sp.]
MSITIVRRSNNKQVLHAKMAPACFATMLALGMVMPVQAAIIADNSSSQQPSIHTNANGATIVDINKASAEGVSHNVYSQFNVDQNGVILNNSGASTNTQLAGQIDGNANMANGSAKVILNEVRSSDPSQLNGMVEVAGQSARVIIANPSGITCDGCGFINTNHATLSTGTATFDAKGNVNGFDVKRGQVVITGKGMDTSSTQYTDIIARSVKVNAQLKANELNITTGSNHFDKNGRVTAIEGEGNAPQLALDVSSLGSMYANKIYMKGTEAGVGVRIDHADLTANDSLSIDTNGVLENNGGRISGANNVELHANDVLNRNGQIVSNDMVSVNANGTVDNTQGKITGQYVNVNGKNTLNNKGNIQGSRSVNVTADSLDNFNGNISSGGDLSLNRSTTNNYYNGNPGDGLNNRNGNITAKGNINIDIANVDNSAGHLTSEGALNVNTDMLINDHGVISSGNVNKTSWSSINASMLNNNDGTIIANGADDMLNINADYNISNRGGDIHSNGSLMVSGMNALLDNASGSLSADKDLSIYTNAYSSDANSVMKAGQRADISVSNSFQNAGLIKAGQDISLNLDSQGWYNYSSPAQNSGIIDAAGNLIVQMSSSDFVNSGSITANQMNWQMSSLTNSGTINSRNNIAMYANNLNNNGQIHADGSSDINASWLINDLNGEISANRDANVMANNYFSNSGSILAGNNVNVTAMSYDYSPVTADNFGKISAGNSLNLHMDGANFYNRGSLDAGNIMSVDARYINNEGVITSEGDVHLNADGGINNNVSGEITGNKVITTGYVNNMGTITQTGNNQDDNGNTDNGNTDNGNTDNGNTDNGNTDNGNTDNGNTDNGNTDNGNTDNGNTDNGTNTADTQANGTPAGNGVWEDGVVYAPGDMYNGHLVQDIIFYPGGYIIATAW